MSVMMIAVNTAQVKELVCKTPQVTIWDLSVELEWFFGTVCDIVR